FPPFHLNDALRRLATYASANVFGGLPLYVHGTAGAALAACLAAILLGLSALIVIRCRVPLLLAGCVAPPLGLLSLGMAFDNTPIELRYLAFAMPFAAPLLAGALASLPRRTRYPLLAVVLSLQAVSLAGMLARPET